MCGSPNYSYQPLIRIHLRVNNQRCFNYFLISLYSMSSMETQKIEASFISLRSEKVESTNL
ncbi:hypothetical protein AtEden1_Chr3g0192611 [Arabidopsis thaliana]